MVGAPYFEHVSKKAEKLEFPYLFLAFCHAGYPNCVSLCVFTDTVQRAFPYRLRDGPFQKSIPDAAQRTVSIPAHIRKHLLKFIEVIFSVIAIGNGAGPDLYERKCSLRLKQLGKKRRKKGLVGIIFSAFSFSDFQMPSVLLHAQPCTVGLEGQKRSEKVHFYSTALLGELISCPLEHSTALSAYLCQFERQEGDKMLMS